MAQHPEDSTSASLPLQQAERESDTAGCDSVTRRFAVFDPKPIVEPLMAAATAIDNAFKKVQNQLTDLHTKFNDLATRVAALESARAT
ncbi:hypothetical protein NLG97_g7694 [Lecanicillium saksenae]|uniref:Uncharacterized protein n=1 Tax=Lecanicillium saksenae TaxID=468837 RepID=A0ACC1QNE1_9HYPO|nr:hypothetical protein NLG97_g7694 [Lecanicillium saksenae]